LNVPTFPGPLVALQAPATPLGGNAPSSHQLNFQMQTQTQTNWCWAATSTSVSLYFDRHSQWSQCKVANTTLKKKDCCSGGAASVCNIPYFLDLALTTTGNFDRISNGEESFPVVRNEIEADRPLCIRVGWAGGGGHFLCIVGWIQAASGVEYYWLSDPIYGVSRVTLATLAGSYQGTGKWSHSYFVRSSAAPGMAAAAPAQPGTIGA
jgi:hypothetical protein